MMIRSHPALGPSLRGLLAFGVFVVAGPGCGDDAPQFTLQQVMLEIDGARKDLERSLTTSGGFDKARASAEAMEWWSEDAAFERYLERSDLLANPERFPVLRSEYDVRLAELITHLREGKEEEARSVYPKLTASCDGCHAIYRPVLIPR